MKIALLGTRGIPANYGGFETFAEQLSVRLAARGHEVTVYCRTNNVSNVGPAYRGVRLALLPTIAHKYFDTLAHTFLSTLHLALHHCDVALYCNGANAIFTPLPRLLGMPAVLNVDGLERQRRKWNALARGWYRLSERLSTWFPSAVVSDARVIQQYYAEQYGKQTRFIAYGAEAERVATTATLEQWGLRPGEYFLYVSRMEPENNALLVVRAFEQARTAKKLVMVGDAPYAAEYIRQVKQTADPRILFTGAVYGQGYSELQSHCFAYVHATEVGGTHPALIEAMGRACVVLYLDTPENREVAGEVGFVFNKEEAGLAAAIESVDGLPEERRRQIGSAALESARSRYDWDAVVEEYERLFESLLRR
jgi:glycosyltransferase involved in cell wall biosynthesis